MTTLQAQPLSAETSHLFAPFGSVIQARPGGAAINSGSSQRHEAVPALDLQREGGRAVLAVYMASARRFPFAAHGLERHRLSEQVFLPLAGARRCVLLVAPAGLHKPRAEDCLAFVTQGDQGVRIAAGTWHHGLLALDDGPWAVLERRAEALDCDEIVWAAPLTVSIPVELSA